MTDDPILERLAEIEISCLDKSRPERTLLAILFLDMSIGIMRKIGKSESFIDYFLEEMSPVIYRTVRTSQEDIDAMADAMCLLTDAAGVELTFSVSPGGILRGRPLAGRKA
jgi:hypothetical protein